MQKVVVTDVIRKFLVMTCNCSSDLCIDISSDTQCSPNSIMIVNVILKGEQASVLWSETNAILQRGAITIESMGINYSLTCVVKTLCPEVVINTTSVPSIDPAQNNVSGANDDGNIVVIVTIGVPLLLVGLFVIVLVFVVAIVYRVTKRNFSTSNVDEANKCSVTLSPPHQIEGGNLDNVMISSNGRQSPPSSTTPQVNANNFKIITIGNSSSSPINSMHEENSDSSADSGVGSPSHKELFHRPSGMNHDECNVYQPSDHHLPSQSITPSIKSHPSGTKAGPKSLTLSDSAHSIMPSLFEHNRSQQESVGDE